jgi:hypothetical protein
MEVKKMKNEFGIGVVEWKLPMNKRNLKYKIGHKKFIVQHLVFYSI